VPNSFALKIKRRETPFYRFLYNAVFAVRTASLPLPRFLNPLLRAMYSAHQAFMTCLRWMATFFYYQPLFRGRCQSMGKRFILSKLPFIIGHTEIYIGDDVHFFGKVNIFSGRIFDRPKLVLHNRVDLGHNVSFTVNKEIVIEDDVNVASGVVFMDTDAHPRDVEERIADMPPKPEEIKPVRVCKKAWIGGHSFIMKGVTIGEGAIIGVNSVVINDIPPYCVAVGNPARVIVKNTRTDAVPASRE
jgi:acetyltransferase-like isoleucine patch superfamily enzyme